MKQILILLMILFILLSVQGCGEVVDGSAYDKWQWMSGDLYFRASGDKVCRHRCAMIAKSMMESGKAFDLVFGTAPWSGEKHVRIEYWRDGELIILEPMWADRDANKFIEEGRWSYIPGEDANIRVISWANRVLVEIGEEPFHPEREAI